MLHEVELLVAGCCREVVAVSRRSISSLASASGAAAIAGSFFPRFANNNRSKTTTRSG
jgi:hypothetical protein